MKSITIGMDLGDKKIMVCVLNENIEKILKKEISNSKKELNKLISKYKNSKIIVALETGTHSPWISRHLEKLGCEVLVGNSRKLRMIYKNDRKSDEQDAEMLARIAKLDPELLSPIKHRSEKCHADLTLVKSRVVLLDSRKKIINNIRSISKTFGERLPSCTAKYFHKKVLEFIPEILKESLLPLLETIEHLTKQIDYFDKKMTELSEEKYPETKILKQITGVGPITSLAFVLTLETPDKFEKSRDVGAFLGMVPRRDQSGRIDKQLPISKKGDSYVRQSLVNCAQYILGVFGKDCDLRRFGERIMIRGGKNGKKRAVVAVARKLSVLMHKLWKTGDIYDPFYNSNKNKCSKKVA